jgi:formate dehydrogenase major subunit
VDLPSATNETLRIARANETPSICPYCACGCGVIVSSEHGRPVNIEGDPDHPINQGSLCPKGAGMFQVTADSAKLRNQKVRYRAPGKDTWEEKDWPWAMAEIAKRMKQTRDKDFIANENGLTVNRTESLAVLGGAAVNNEECYLWVKLMRALGLVYIEHQARI